jgi:hypothetical protein
MIIKGIREGRKTGRKRKGKWRREEYSRRKEWFLVGRRWNGMSQTGG